MNKLLELMVLAFKESENKTVKAEWSFYYIGGLSFVNIIYYREPSYKDAKFERLDASLSKENEVEAACKFIQERLLFPPAL
jgi:hypothetical protein